MVALLIGALLVLFAVYTVLPVAWSVQWWQDVLALLRGAIPLLAFSIGLIAFFVGIADMRDKAESGKEEAGAASTSKPDEPQK